MVRQVRVAPGEIIVLVKGLRVTRVFKEGRHFIFGSGRAIRFDLDRTVFPGAGLTMNQMRTDVILNEHYKLVDLGSNEIAVLNRGKRLIQVYRGETFAVWNSDLAPEVEVFDMSGVELPAALPEFARSNALMVPFIRAVKVPQGEIALLFVNGELKRTLKPGVHEFWRNDVEIVTRAVSTRIQTVLMSGQELLTKDKAGIRLNFAATFKIVEPERMVASINSATEFLHNEASLAIREIVGTTTLDNLLTSREQSSEQIFERIEKAAKEVGIAVMTSGIKDIILPGEMKEILNKVIVAEKEAQASVIKRREETAAVRNSLNAAKLMEENPILLKLKEFEVIERISEKVATLNLSGNGHVLEQLRALTSVD